MGTQRPSEYVSPDDQGQFFRELSTSPPSHRKPNKQEQLQKHNLCRCQFENRWSESSRGEAILPSQPSSLGGARVLRMGVLPMTKTWMDRQNSCQDINNISQSPPFWGLLTSACPLDAELPMVLCFFFQVTSPVPMKHTITLTLLAPPIYICCQVSLQSSKPLWPKSLHNSTWMSPNHLKSIMSQTESVILSFSQTSFPTDFSFWC